MQGGDASIPGVYAAVGSVLVARTGTQPGQPVCVSSAYPLNRTVSLCPHQLTMNGTDPQSVLVVDGGHTYHAIELDQKQVENIEISKWAIAAFHCLRTTVS